MKPDPPPFTPPDGAIVLTGEEAFLSVEYGESIRTWYEPYEAIRDWLDEHYTGWRLTEINERPVLFLDDVAAVIAFKLRWR